MSLQQDAYYGVPPQEHRAHAGFQLGMATAQCECGWVVYVGGRNKTRKTNAAIDEHYFLARIAAR